MAYPLFDVGLIMTHVYSAKPKALVRTVGLDIYVVNMDVVSLRS